MERIKGIAYKISWATFMQRIPCVGPHAIVTAPPRTQTRPIAEHDVVTEAVATVGDAHDYVAGNQRRDVVAVSLPRLGMLRVIGGQFVQVAKLAKLSRYPVPDRGKASV